jgi:hypothetical protein
MPYRIPAVDEDARRDEVEVQAFARELARGRRRGQAIAVLVGVLGSAVFLVSGCHVLGSLAPPPRPHVHPAPTVYMLRVAPPTPT